jgi:hypothetical protein
MSRENLKGEIHNPKHQIQNTKQIPNPNVPMYQMNGASRLGFVVCDLVLV